jgi:hypothetical protein
MALFQGASSRANRYHTTITVGSEGDGYKDTYFPVWWWGGSSHWGSHKIQISRQYSAAGPSEHGTHKAGIKFECRSNNNDWGGDPHTFTLVQYQYTYRSCIAGAGGTAHNMKFYALLRAGGYVYNIVTEGFEPGVTIGNHTTDQNTYSAGSPSYLSGTTSNSYAQVNYHGS